MTHLTSRSIILCFVVLVAGSLFMYFLPQRRIRLRTPTPNVAIDDVVHTPSRWGIDDRDHTTKVATDTRDQVKMGGMAPALSLDRNRVATVARITARPSARTEWAQSIEETLAQQNGLMRELRRQLEESIVKPDRSYASAFHLVVIALGDFRDRQSLPSLVTHLDFELDDSVFQPGSCNPNFFPVADAIANIGGLDAADSLVHRANEPMSGRQIFLSAWILRESLSKNGAQGYLRSSFNGAKSPLQVRNLLRLIEFMDSELANVTMAGVSGAHIDAMMQKHFPEWVEAK